MTEAVVDDIVAVLPPLLNALEALGFFQRHLHPPAFASVMDAIGTPDEALQTAHAAIGDWPEQFAGLRERLDRACGETLAAFAGIREVERGHGDLVAVFRALRHVPRAQEALYPLAVKFPPVSGFFLNAANRDNADLLSKLEAGASEDTGIFHDHNEPGSRGGFSVYVPEYYTPERAMPLVMALHGGSGNGRGFLWSWLRDARSLGAILVAPTATGPTWALMGDDTDTPNLMRILEAVRSRWSITPSRMLLTGMSDGGTFCYVTGLDGASPFTHLAPVAATFHPLMAEMADATRLQGLPVFITHGKLDWMFPVQTARQTQAALSAGGADVIYREVDDLSHTYPREINAELMEWLNAE
ncbi:MULTISPECIES: phospholipase [Bradyrhizobium]|uniref:carboxylesterase family protein n=1 Tax=Bradyrhizobium TaxID=374 RepID=UPI00155E9F80|nr:MULTISPECIES: phospholipase [Bradyrhizobium]MDD1519659.1 phospholipase [Bradyrhizobium sp. WBAH30]MDD1543903.1 phospholipase [Bradyrhizobium sp. WBAH41]MDD1557812.1 phospholipase [Bradyrhizobium sp. WBAH23]MDD1565225.1 phospholipase [Bradyrhizobium sp. WBAH33]MDD1592284.1 phospholipase [Bradyrhizobium sp. WBAH42]